MEEGIVAGGGTTLVQLASSLDGLKAILKGDERTGVEIVQRSLAAPLMQIAHNAGYDGTVIASEVVQRNLGFNAATGTYEDLLAAGIIDAAKVVRLGLQDAVSIAAMLLTTEAVIADKPEPAAPAAPGGDGGMGGMGGMMGGMGGMGMPGMM